jgi:predicted RNase H-like nuclease (RuvC/YqgF family)
LSEEENKERVRDDNPGTGANPEQKVADVERVITDKESVITTLKKSEKELKDKVAALSKSLTEAVSSYKERVIQMNPEITEELISGDTIEAVNTSLEKAISLVGRVKKSVEKEISHVRVPAGAPGRRTSDLSALTPREKIQYAIGGKK